MHGYVISNDQQVGTRTIILQLGDTTYILRVLYGEVSHFVSFYSCDRMANNAEFVEYKTSTGKFPTYNQDFALLVGTAVVYKQSIIRTEIRNLQGKSSLSRERSLLLGDSSPLPGE